MWNPVAEMDYQPGVLILKTKQYKGFSTKSETLTSKMETLGGKLKRSVPEYLGKKGINVQSIRSDIQVWEFSPTADMSAISEEVRKDRFTDYAEPNYIIRAFSTPNDPLYSTQEYLSESELSEFFTIPEKYEVIVAVIDSGIELTHEDLKNKLYLNTRDPINGIDDDSNGLIDDYYGYNFNNYAQTSGNSTVSDAAGHGTQMAGIIAGESNNKLGMVGMSDKARLLAVTALQPSGIGYQYDAAMAIRYAVDQGARIINCSWGFTQYSSILKDAVQYAHSNGAIIFAAVGNTGQNREEYPAAFSQTIGIGSITRTKDTRSYFSNFNDQVDFVTYGETVKSTDVNNTYKRYSGTSQATAIFSGIAARLISHTPDLTNEELKEILIVSSTDLYDSGKDIYTGYGKPNPTKIKTYLGIKPEKEEPFWKKNKLIYFAGGWIIDCLQKIF